MTLPGSRAPDVDLEMVLNHAGERSALLDGESILASGRMHPGAYSSYRSCTCLGASCFFGLILAVVGARLFQVPAAALALVVVGALIAIFPPLIYWAACRGSRDEEARRTVAHLTHSHVYLFRYIYWLGCCCYRRNVSVIPLEKIQDLALTDNWLSTLCSWNAPGTKYFKMEVQSAGSSGGRKAELIILCIVDPTDFRAKVLAARRSLMGQANPKDLVIMEDMHQAVGHGRSAPQNGGGPSHSGGATATLLGPSAPALTATLQRLATTLERVDANFSAGASKV